MGEEECVTSPKSVCTAQKTNFLVAKGQKNILVFFFWKASNTKTFDQKCFQQNQQLMIQLGKANRVIVTSIMWSAKSDTNKKGSFTNVSLSNVKHSHLRVRLCSVEHRPRLPQTDENSSGNGPVKNSIAIDEYILQLHILHMQICFHGLVTLCQSKNRLQCQSKFNKARVYCSLYQRNRSWQMRRVFFYRPIQ